MALTATVIARVISTLTGSGDLFVPSGQMTYNLKQEFTDGTGNDKADLLFTDKRTLAASANEDLDLAGVLSSALGATITMAKVKTILIHAAAANTNNVVISPADVNGVLLGFGAAAHSFAVPPDGWFMAVDPNVGWTVTAGTGDLLNIANSGAGTGVTYDVILIGATA